MTQTHRKQVCVLLTVWLVNAPDSPIRYYIIGERPQGSFNEQYTFINDRQANASMLESRRQIYQQ